MNPNREQALASRPDRGVTLVIAGAGTGKTSCLIGKTRNLIEHGVVRVGEGSGGEGRALRRALLRGNIMEEPTRRKLETAAHSHTVPAVKAIAKEIIERRQKQEE